MATILKSLRIPILTATFFLVISASLVILGSFYIKPGDGTLYYKQQVDISSPTRYVQTIVQVWDSKHYFDLSTDGYHRDKLLYRYAFFPLLPVQAKVINSIISRPSLSLYLASSINFIAFSCILYLFITKWMAREKSEANPVATLITSLLVPFSFYFYLPYTESLFNFLLVSILYIIEFAQRKWWWLLPIATYMLSLSRNLGVLACIILAIYLFASIRSKEKDWKKVGYLIGSMVSSVAGICTFLYYGYLMTGNFWISREVQARWGRTNNLRFWETFNTYWNHLWNSSAFVQNPCGGNPWCYNGAVLYPMIGLALATISIITLIVIYPKRVSTWAIVAFSLVLMITPMTTEKMDSYYRYMTTVPAYFLMMPLILHHKLPDNIMRYAQIGLAMFQSLLLVLFGLFYWLV